MNEEYNILNIAYDLLAQNPVAGSYDMKGRERDYITNMVDYVDEDKQAIYLKSKKTGKEYRLQLVADYAPAREAQA